MKAALAIGILAAIACVAGCASSASRKVSAPVTHAFAIEGRELLLDGKPFVLRAGEMDSARVPRELWRERLRMVKALGCNAVATAVAWADHEPRPGEMRFDGQEDVAEYCRVAREEGLVVVVRIGPYVGAERELGGLPWWLLQGDAKLRTRDPRFLAAVERWFARLGKELAPLQSTRGGPILFAQIEDGYGSFGDDAQYLAALRDIARKNGLELPLTTCDAPEGLAKGTCDGVVASVAIGSAPEAAFAKLAELRPDGPRLCGAYYTGWFDAWGKPHRATPVASMLDDLGGMLERGESFVLYVAHGGTNWGDLAGADAPPFSPHSTSRDFDAPIDEAGRATRKLHALRALFAQYAPDEGFPAIPPSPAIVAVPEFSLGEGAAVLADLPPPVRGRAGEHTPSPVSFETLDQPHGCVLYRSELPAGPPATLRLGDVDDLAWVRVGGALLDVLDRRTGRTSIKLGERDRAATLDVLVEAMGRVGYGPKLDDRKGLLGPVELADGKRTTAIGPWDHVLLPFDAAAIEHARWKRVTKPLGEPALYRGAFELARAGGVFLDMRGWSHGSAWVNGHALGRYWSIGPQQTLSVPSCWTKKGANVLVVLDLDGSTTTLASRGLDAPILDRADASTERRLRKAGQELALGDMAPAIQETFADDAREKKLVFPGVRGRYVAFVAKSSSRADPRAACAELFLLGRGAVELPRSSWNVIWADSEALGAENGAAVNAIDGDPQTAWRTEASASFPHAIVIDLGEEQTVSGIRFIPTASSGAVLPHPGDATGRVGGWALYVSKERFGGI